MTTKSKFKLKLMMFILALTLFILSSIGGVLSSYLFSYREFIFSLATVVVYGLFTIKFLSDTLEIYDSFDSADDNN